MESVLAKDGGGLVWLLCAAFVGAVLTLDSPLWQVRVIGKIAFAAFILACVILKKKIGNWWD